MDIIGIFFSSLIHWQIEQGDADFICNWLGNFAWMEALEWPGQGDYKRQPIHKLRLSADSHKTIGSVKSNGRNFTFIRLHDGGHMIPFDQPLASLDMFNRWLGGEWWGRRAAA